MHNQSTPYQDGHSQYYFHDMWLLLHASCYSLQMWSYANALKAQLLCFLCTFWLSPLSAMLSLVLQGPCLLKCW